ncbi:hypothetical protein CPB85DRAFT_1437877 [Mucidula mucida]|nr:hypothetical protein CPB85DRAFT_1437877 [Mucidula mucida]
MITKPFKTSTPYSKARGYPPLDPETLQPHPSPTWPLEGAQIGDLVLLDLSGALLYVGINVTKDADDPRNWQRLPKDYKPCPLELGIDYTVNPSQFPSPTILGATSGPTDEFEYTDPEFLDSRSILVPLSTIWFTLRQVKTAVIHDNDILSLLQNDEVLLPSDAELARRMVTSYVISVHKAGGAVLQAKSDVKLGRWAKIRLLNRRGFLSVRQKDPVLELSYFTVV